MDAFTLGQTGFGLRQMHQSRRQKEKVESRK
jgi:hypothetical protein